MRDPAFGSAVPGFDRALRMGGDVQFDVPSDTLLDSFTIRLRRIAVDRPLPASRDRLLWRRLLPAGLCLQTLSAYRQAESSEVAEMEEAFTSSAWFHTETLVAMADGSMQEIQFIGVGAMIQSIDFATGLICGRRVTRVLFQEQMPIVRVHYRVEPSHEEMPLQTTPRSLFRPSGQRRVPALDFVAGDVIETASRRNAPVSHVVPQRHLADVHCLDVEGFESYLVGSERLVVCRPTSSG